jgi:hypothetical protein
MPNDGTSDSLALSVQCWSLKILRTCLRHRPNVVGNDISLDICERATINCDMASIRERWHSFGKIHDTWRRSIVRVSTRLMYAQLVVLTCKVEVRTA